MTNNNRSTLIAICLALMLLLASCAQAAPPLPEPTAIPTPQAQPATPESQINKLSIAAGSIADAWHPWGTELATAVTQTVPHTEMSVKTTASRMEDLKLLLNGQVESAFAYDYHIVLANQGQLMQAFPDVPIETLTIKCGVEVERPTFPDYSQPARVALPLDEQPLQIITTAATGITTLDDLRGRRISLGPPGSVSTELAVLLLDGLGFDLATDIVIETLTVEEAMTALAQGELDGFFLSEPIPSPETAVLFAAAAVPIVMIPIGENEAAQYGCPSRHISFSCHSRPDVCQPRRRGSYPGRYLCPRRHGRFSSGADEASYRGSFGEPPVYPGRTNASVKPRSRCLLAPRCSRLPCPAGPAGPVAPR